MKSSNFRPGPPRQHTFANDTPSPLGAEDSGLRPIPFGLRSSEAASPRGGQLLVDAVCRRFGVWDTFQNYRTSTESDPRSRQRVAQLLFSLTSGGTTLDHAAALARDPVFLGMIGLESGANQALLMEWLCEQTEDDISALRHANSELVSQAILECIERPSDCPLIDVVFQESHLPHMADSATAWRWETVSLGPFLLDGIVSIGSTADKGNELHLPALLGPHVELWKKIRSCFCNWMALHDAGSLNAISGAGFTAWEFRPGQSMNGNGSNGSASLQDPPNSPNIGAKILNDFSLGQISFPKLNAVSAYLAIGALAYNIINYIRIVLAPLELTNLSTGEIISQLLTAPAFLVRKRMLYVYLPGDLLGRSRDFIAASTPRRKRWPPAADRLISKLAINGRAA